MSIKAELPREKTKDEKVIGGLDCPWANVSEAGELEL
jgi:hypothetical protein